MRIPESILAILIGARLLLWWKYRHDMRARRFAVSTAQLIAVGAWVGAYDFFRGTHLNVITGLVVLVIAGLSCIPVPQKSAR